RGAQCGEVPVKKLKEYVVSLLHAHAAVELVRHHGRLRGGIRRVLRLSRGVVAVDSRSREELAERLARPQSARVERWDDARVADDGVSLAAYVDQCYRLAGPYHQAGRLEPAAVVDGHRDVARGRGDGRWRSLARCADDVHGVGVAASKARVAVSVQTEIG